MISCTCKNCYWINENILKEKQIYWCDEHSKQVSKNGTCYFWKDKNDTCNNDYCEVGNI